ncbi:SGNH/GDSL hydrolase family protein [Lentisphaera marina]|uniref:SGNH/GDSL hydrolase family protein n=1 Tax=Lentisphaera marina TaxID=1111041 RepID=UPI0023670099|nr:SGNH/GDSL hydrolase family protein [Lentisphaera marina]MDD7986607.1 SGNH/GDSL hydrolase family protein [Lentisphaera marina]
MRFFTLLSLLTFSLISQEINIEKMDKKMAIAQADENGIIWYDVKSPPFKLEGFAWFKDEQIFKRLAKFPSQPIRIHVENLAYHTAGGQAHFQTDSSKILIRAKLSNKSNMYHMPSTGQSGFDIYSGAPGHQLYLKTSRFKLNQTQVTSELFKGNPKLRNFVINFPLYNGVKSLEVGIKAGSQITAPLPRKNKGKILVYGTSITQGGCAARPGLAYTNILSRRLDYEFINLGFSGNGRGEPELAKLIQEVEDKTMIILDYEANANEGIKNTLENFIDIIREKHPTIPLLIISRILPADAIHNKVKYEKLQSLSDFQKSLVTQKKKFGDKNIYFLDGKSLLGEHAHEATVDGTHPNSYGFMIMAENIQPTIEKILNK